MSTVKLKKNYMYIIQSNYFQEQLNYRQGDEETSKKRNKRLHPISQAVD